MSAETHKTLRRWAYAAGYIESELDGAASKMHATIRAEVLAEVKTEVVAWLVKKAAERQMWDAATLASKVDRGAVRAFIGTAHYRDAMDAHRAEVLREAGGVAVELIAAVPHRDPDGLAKVDAYRVYSDRLHEIADGGMPSAQPAQPAPTQVWYLFEEDTPCIATPRLFTTKAAAEQGTIDQYQAGGEYSPDYSWRTHEDGAHELLAGGEPVGIYLAPVPVRDTPPDLSVPKPDFFQPGHAYTSTTWAFRCVAVTPSPTAGESRALGWMHKPGYGWYPTALDPDDWEHGGWTEGEASRG